METIFKTGYNKIINLFYSEKFVKIHLREIARKTKLNENSVSRFLNQLEENNILKSEKEGNLKKYFISKNKLVFSLFSILDVEKFEELPVLRKNAVNYLLDRLNIKPLAVILFGSSAKGNFSKNSDIDLLLIVNEKIKTKIAEDYSESQTGIKINILQVNYKDFVNELKIKEDKVIQSALETGYPIFNPLFYYQEVLK